MRRYRYYNWRKDTSSDLFLILGINATFIVGGALLKFVVVDPVLSGSDLDPRNIAAAAFSESHQVRCAHSALRLPFRRMV